MRVDGKHFRSIWLEPDGWTVGAIDQRKLPHEFVVAQLATVEAAADAIRAMLVRGAPLIGATAAYGMALAMRAHASDAAIDRAYKLLIATRPTAINLKWALDEMRAVLQALPPSARAAAAYARAADISEQDIDINQGIARCGLALIEAIAAKKQRGAEEVTDMTGRTADGRIETVRIVPDGSPVANYGFDVTPARLVTGLITERGVLSANREALSAAFPERIAAAAE